MRKILFIVLFATFLLVPAFCEKYSDKNMEFNVPDVLEIQNETFSAIKQMAYGVDFRETGGVYQVVLQQKGLNALKESALNQFCRVMISVVDDSDATTNDEFKQAFNKYSSTETQALYDFLLLIFNGDTELVSSPVKNTATIGGKFAVHLSYTRKSTEGNGNVYVDGYYLVTQGHQFFVSCSYRVDEKQIFASAVDEFMKSFKILTAENTASGSTGVVKSRQLYQQTLPWVSTSFLWPDKKADWKQTSDYSGTTKVLDYEVPGDSLLITASVVNMKSKVSSRNQDDTLFTLQGTLLREIRLALQAYDYKIIYAEIYNKTLDIKYEYTAYGVRILGRASYRFADKYRFISVESEYDESDSADIEKIYKSFGF